MVGRHAAICGLIGGSEGDVDVIIRVEKEGHLGERVAHGDVVEVGFDRAVGAMGGEGQGPIESVRTSAMLPPRCCSARA